MIWLIIAVEVVGFAIAMRIIWRGTECDKEDSTLWEEYSKRKVE